MRQPWFQTASGRTIDLDAAPHTWPIAIEDIAAGLSKICRWGGHTRHFYSVAQHSYEMAQLAKAEFALELLLHDAAEAYLGDVISPMKQWIRERTAAYDDLEKAVLDAIADKFGLLHGFAKSPNVSKYDLRMLHTENLQLCARTDRHLFWAKTLPPPLGIKIKPTSPRVAEQKFLDVFRGIKK